MLILILWVVVSIWFSLKIMSVSGSTNGGIVKDEKKPVMLASIPVSWMSKLSPEQRLTAWERKNSLLDEVGNEEPTLPNFVPEKE